MWNNHWLNDLYSRCHSCGGVGSVTCTTCKGQGKLLCFIKLKITWWEDMQLVPLIRTNKRMYFLIHAFFSTRLSFQEEQRSCGCDWQAFGIPCWTSRTNYWRETSNWYGSNGEQGNIMVLTMPLLLKGVFWIFSYLRSMKSYCNSNTQKHPPQFKKFVETNIEIFNN